jgi:hypothetical protein
MPAAQGPKVQAKGMSHLEPYQEAAPSTVEPKQRHYLVASPKILTLVSELQNNLEKIGGEIATTHYFAKLLTETSGPDSNDCKQVCRNLLTNPDTDKVPGDPFRHLGIVSRAQNLSKIAQETYIKPL